MSTDNLGEAELAALERFRKRKAKLDTEAIVKESKTDTVEIPGAAKSLTDREIKAVNVKKQMVTLLALEIKKLFKSGLDDGKLITLDIQSDSGSVINPDNLSDERLAEMSLSELSKIRFRVDILNQIIETARKIYQRKESLSQIFAKFGVKTSGNYQMTSQADDEKEFLELVCYVLCQETSINLMNIYYACKNFSKSIS